jgi:hypothetical protein
MKVIFLDIDGVLNCATTKERWGGFIGMSEDKVLLFNRILEETGAYVVLSSTWRHDKDWLETMFRNGLNIDRFIGRTKDLGGMRGFEINEWLSRYQENHYIENFVILDDDSDMLPGQKLFRTTWEHGLTEDIANQIIEYFKN